MTAPRVKVMRLEIMLTQMEDCDTCAVRDEDVGDTALARVRKVWMRKMMARCGCFDLVVSRVSRKSEAGGAARGKKSSVGLMQRVGVEGKV